MKIHAGYEISYTCAQPTPMILMLSAHPSRALDLLTPDQIQLTPAVPAKEYLDGFGNICHVIHVPAGSITLSADFLIRDSGRPDEVAPDAEQHSLERLPVETRNGSPASVWTQSSLAHIRCGEQKQRQSTAEPEIYEPCSSCLATPKIESTVRYLGIEVDDALAIAEQVDV